MRFLKFFLIAVAAHIFSVAADAYSYFVTSVTDISKKSKNTRIERPEAQGFNYKNTMNDNYISLRSRTPCYGLVFFIDPLLAI